jgi:hypothetical protein
LGSGILQAGFSALRVFGVAVASMHALGALVVASILWRRDSLHANELAA